MDFSKIFTDFRKSSGKSQKDFAEALDIPQTTWAGYELGKSEPKLGTLIKLAEMGYTIPGLTTGGLSDMKARHLVTDSDTNEMLAQAAAFPKDMKADGLPPLAKIAENGGFAIPILDQALSAGSGQPLPDGDEPTGYIAAPKELRRYGSRLAALHVSGDSMEPTLHRGDLVVCDSCGWDGEGIYALRMDGCGYVKRLARKPGKIVVISDNPKYETWEEPAESGAIDIIGRVHYTLKRVD